VEVVHRDNNAAQGRLRTGRRSQNSWSLRRGTASRHREPVESLCQSMTSLLV
jgi:hypothetical protein